MEASKKIELKTNDGELIAATWYDVVDSKGGVVFTHMMPATKESWSELAKKCANEGYTTLALDLRGHGESSGGPRGYEHFTNAEHQKSILDLDAAVKFLLGKGIMPSDVILVGASIGANLSLKYLADHPELHVAVALSPGLDYRGITTPGEIKKLNKTNRILFIASKDDGDNAEQTKILFGLAPDGVDAQIKVYEVGGHGTDIIKNYEERSNFILNFISGKK